MNEPWMKPCPHCAEPLPEGARRCPNCRAWISAKPWWLSRYTLQTGIGVVLAVVFIFCMERALNRSGESFDDYRDQVVVVDSKMEYAHDQPGVTVTILGRIRNDSPVKWNRPYFEVQCLDQGGDLVDSHSAHDWDMVFPSKMERTFRLSFTANRKPSDYAKHKVFIRDAQDAQRWP